MSCGAVLPGVSQRKFKRHAIQYRKTVEGSVLQTIGQYAKSKGKDVKLTPVEKYKLAGVRPGRHLQYGK